jgi:hypothetical protein
MGATGVSSGQQTDETKLFASPFLPAKARAAPLRAVRPRS